MANNVDPDQTPHSAASDLGLHCLQSSIRHHTYWLLQYQQKMLIIFAFEGDFNELTQFSFCGKQG